MHRTISVSRRQSYFGPSAMNLSVRARILKPFQTVTIYRDQERAASSVVALFNRSNKRFHISSDLIDST